MKKYKIPFNKPCIVGKELEYIKKAIEKGKLSGNGEFTKKCDSFIEKKFGIKKALLTTSGTDALEMACILLDLKQDDEIILPSYTFVSSVNAILLRGARPVFADIRPDTLNIDENKLEEKITDKTKAIMLVDYAGIGCEMDKIRKIAEKYNLYIIEDAAQGVNAKYKNRYLGSFGDVSAYSFHETKNYIAGEGGALLINNEKFIERAEIIWEKGTNRQQFFRGEIDKYTWVDIGSSFLPSELNAAYLWAQFEHLDDIQNKRKELFEYYYTELKQLEEKKVLSLPIISNECSPNYHIFYLILKNEKTRNSLMDHLKSKGILAVFHYIPLHLSPMGKKIGYKNGDFPITEDLSERLLRLPMYYSLTETEQDYIIKNIIEFFY